MNKITYCNLIPKDCEVMKLDMPDGNISLLLAEKNNGDVMGGSVFLVLADRKPGGDIVHLLLSKEQWAELKGLNETKIGE